ncbi:MAG: hypothetical protein ACNA7W_13870 [Pseudomonadales bacterium]
MMRKLLLLAVMGGVAYGLRKLYEDIERHPGAGSGEEEHVAAGERPESALTGSAQDAEVAATQERLDEALRESFPASDPPSLGRPS